MPRPWTPEEKQKYFADLKRLYVKEGKTISEIGKMLSIAAPTVFQRLKYFGIPSNPAFKSRQDVVIPSSYTPEVAEFFGIMLGDGKLSHFQIAVTLGTKEMTYALYVVDLIANIFNARPKIGIRKTGHKDVYLGSVAITKWLQKEGLVFNKVLAQVDAPRWIFKEKEYTNRFLRGFFDTDGSVYKLRWGVQIAFNNKSIPLLKSTRTMLVYLGYAPSKVSGYKVYLTRKEDVKRFFKEIQPKNLKHQERFGIFSNYYTRAGTQAVNEDAL